jgi:SAM-dependent methyltransferase
MTAYRDIGDELDVFAHAHNWKAYLRSQAGTHLTGDVLEVGAGIGGTTRVFCDGRQRSWTCLEPDRDLAARLETTLAAAHLAIAPSVIVGTVGDLPPAPAYDAVLYIDVLEHIEDDRGELARACALVRPGGVVLVLAPAHQQLYTAFDAGIGHFRRATARCSAPHAAGGGARDAAVSRLGGDAVGRQPPVAAIRPSDGRTDPGLGSILRDRAHAESIHSSAGAWASRCSASGAGAATDAFARAAARALLRGARGAALHPAVHGPCVRL